MGRKKPLGESERKLIAEETQRLQARVEMPEDVYRRYKSAFDIGVTIITNSDDTLHVRYQDVDRLGYLLYRIGTNSDSYWTMLRSFIKSPRTNTLKRASVILSNLAECLRSRNLDNVSSHVTELLQMSILPNLYAGKAAFDLGHDHVNKLLVQSRVRANVNSQVRRLRAEKDSAVAQVVRAATRPHLTTPEYRITKTTIRPLPGSYASRQ